MTTWIDFWNAEHALYVNDRHKQLHAKAVARDIISHIPGPNAIVLVQGSAHRDYHTALHYFAPHQSAYDHTQRQAHGLAMPV